MKQKQRNAVESGLEERRRLQENIRQWNSKRISLFEITQPDEDSVFHGVVRFHLQDQISGNFATKCIYISSSSTTQEVIETLLEKFQHDEDVHPLPYSLYEVLNNQEERQMDVSEKPLVLQLNWNEDSDGRFVLRNNSSLQNDCLKSKEKVGVIENFKRTLSRKEKNKNKQKKNNVSCSHTLENNNSECKTNSMKQNDLKVKPNLPLSISLKEKDEDSFLLAVINDINSSTIHFKLSPAYVFYMIGRFLTSTHGQRNKPEQVEQRVSRMFDKIVRLIQDVLQKQRSIAVSLAFWTANASELLNFLRRDRDLCPITLQTQNALAQLVQQAFRFLSHRLQDDLEKHLPAFFTDVRTEETQAKEIEGVLNALMKTMSLLRRCRLNPALSIQLFSQLFHFMGAWILNKLTASGSNLCSNYWSKTLRQRLRHVEAWAERQGLELAVDCHLSRVIQATMLLNMTSHSTRDAEMIQSTCYKLNSLQLRSLMSKDHYGSRQARFPPGLIECVVTLAETTTDVLRAEGGEIRLEEELELHLPFLLPEDGYSSDCMCGVPKGFQEFLEPICRKGLCKLIPHSSCVGGWTVFFGPSDCSTKDSTWKHEALKITLKKPLHGGMGVSIVAAKSVEQDKLGIFIKSVVPGGAANADGRVNPGDQILSVDGRSLVGVSQERAAEIMTDSGSVVTLEIVRSAAVYYGFESVFIQPPQTCEGCDNGGRSKQKSGFSDVFEGKKPSLSSSSRPSETSRNQHTMSRANTKQDQELLRKKREYRSNPNLAYNQEMAVDSAPNEKSMFSFSTDSLMDSDKLRNSPSNTEIYHREYRTLPTSIPHSNKLPRTTRKTAHITALSGDLQKINSMARSQDDLCSAEKGRPLVEKPKFLKKQPEMSKWSSLVTISPMDSSLSSMRNGNVLWKIPKNTQSVPLSQPKRLDVPYTPQDHALSFSTFRQPAETHVTSQTHHHIQHQISDSASRRPQPALKKKTVVFQSPVKKHTASQPSGAEKNLLEQEVHHLQAKVQRSLEESDRLRRLSLELQFQRRLQEYQQDTDEEEEEGCQSERRCLETGSDVVDNCTKTETPADLRKDGHFSPDGVKHETKRISFGEIDHQSLNKRRAPENLTFKERQRLFSLPIVTSSNVKVS